MKRLIIIGAGGHGKVCANIAFDMKKWDSIEFIDDNYSVLKKCLEFKIIGSMEDLPMLPDDYDYFVAIGNNEVRKKIIVELEKMHKKIATLIHPTATIGLNVLIKEGTSIHQNVTINVDSTIGKGCIINTATIVEHENTINDFVHLSPNVALGGQVSIGSQTWIGIGSTIINNVSIGNDIIVGAASLVLQNIEESNKVYYGIVKNGGKHT
ncbi:hypothetical protein CBF34_02715 [Vagococcus penaei]|uniref:Uncharacterized protein n=1 Tax=Vagococcus penaei TaxID=633807 RepID=A0A1Q2D477_9ENTE|nr:acetyltransferase [Vagococcus penaei]AQP53097.1 hypothetical protein BW732_01875 [Vagococcus penaei]RSU06041.1 hypothetical protein CBF34_02715 [Vagococcus penaei]